MNKFKLFLLLCVTVLLVLTFGCITTLASSDLTVSSDKTLTSKFNPYDNVTVKAGKTLTLAKRSGEPVGLEIKKNLVVEAGGKITGDGILIFHKGATYSGITLYYKYNGEYLEIPEGMSLDTLNSSDDYQPSFYFDSKQGIYVLDAEFKGGDPFELNLSLNHGTVIKGEKLELSLSGITKNVKWTSSDKSIATVNKNGVVTGKKLGRVTITATYGKKSYECELEVVKLGLNTKKLYMNCGNEFFLQLNGTKVKSVSSSDKSVAKITKKLKVTAIGEGTCTVTIKGEDGKKYKCTIIVENLEN